MLPVYHFFSPSQYTCTVVPAGYKSIGSRTQRRARRRRGRCPHSPRCTRQANPPEHQGPISDFQASKRARCAGRPDFGLGGRRPQVQNLGRDRLRPFGRGRGCGQVSRPPPWKRANLATRRARGSAMACSAVGRRTGREARIRQTNTTSHAGGDPFFRYRACPAHLGRNGAASHLPITVKWKRGGCNYRGNVQVLWCL